MPQPRIPLSVKRFYETHHEALQMKVIAGDKGMDRLIGEPTINRPGLALAGFTKYFAHRRVQAIGSAETTYLKTLNSEIRQDRYTTLFASRIPCLVLCRSINPDKQMLAAAEQAEVPVFKSPLITMRFISAATLALEAMFARTGTEIGSMVDILGVGVIIKGQSGIGKSECVLGLIERGYSLVSDDVTRVVVQENSEIIGSSPENTRNFMEIRGIGILNVQQMFGVKSVRTHKKVDLVVTLVPWEEVGEIDRVGMEQKSIRIMDIDIPHMEIPVSPGRDAARLIEVAAFHVKSRLMGMNPAQELNERLIANMTKQKKN